MSVLHLSTFFPTVVVLFVLLHPKKCLSIERLSRILRINCSIPDPRFTAVSIAHKKYAWKHRTCILL